MPTALRDEQHELMSEDGSLSIVFGTSDTGYLTTAPPTFEFSDGVIGDTQKVLEDGINFGEDFLGSSSYVFEMGALVDSAAHLGRASRDQWGALKRMWFHPAFRSKQGDIAVLRSRYGDRVMRAYGRPRRFAPTPGPASKRGWTPLVADFVVQDDTWYDDEEQAVSAVIRPQTDGRLIAPLKAPLVTVAAAVPRSSMFIVGGTLPTWLTVTFHGPSTNPVADFGPFKVALNHSIPEGGSVTVDSRPWRRGITRPDGGSLRGRLTYDSPPLRRLRIDPGTYTLSYSAIDLTGTSWCEVRWRDARETA